MRHPELHGGHGEEVARQEEFRRRLEEKRRWSNNQETKYALLALGGMGAVIAGVWFELNPLITSGSKYTATEQPAHDLVANQESLNGGEFKEHIVYDRELRLRIPGTERFERFVMPEGVEEAEIRQFERLVMSEDIAKPKK